MIKFCPFGKDYFLNLYDDNFFIGRRKVYYYRGNYYVKYKGKYRQILDFDIDGIYLASVDIKELL